MQHDHDIANAGSPSATDAAPGLFTPDILLASQQAIARAPDSPCRRLVAAVFERALLDAVGASAKGSDHDDALAWFASDDEEPFTFRWVAFQLGIDPDWVRVRVSRRLEAGRPRPAAASGTRAAETGTRRAA